MPHIKQGILIAVEGIDGSGKTTLAHNLATLLSEKTFDVVLTKEPGGTNIGKNLRNLVLHQETPLCAKSEYLLFAADRAQHFDQLILPALKKNKLIISDRLADSSLAYQGYGRGLEKEIIQTINTWAMYDTKPHLILYVDVPINIAVERLKTRRELTAFDNEQFLQNVSKGFEMLYKNRDDVILIDGTGPQNKIATQAYFHIEQWLQKKNLLL